MADFYENEKTWTLSNGSDVTATSDAAALVTDGGTALDMHTAQAQQVAGQIFTIAGVYACHPETKAGLFASAAVHHRDDQQQRRERDLPGHLPHRPAAERVQVGRHGTRHNRLQLADAHVRTGTASTSYRLRT
jgi:hypothetical protein